MGLFEGIFKIEKDYSGYVRDKDHIPKDHLVRYEAFDNCLRLYRMPILRKTPAGCWVGYSEADKKFVLEGSGKRYAYETEQEAFNSILIRKKWYVKHTTRAFERSTKQLELIEGLKEES